MRIFNRGPKATDPNEIMDICIAAKNNNNKVANLSQKELQTLNKMADMVKSGNITPSKFRKNDLSALKNKLETTEEGPPKVESTLNKITGFFRKIAKKNLNPSDLSKKLNELEITSEPQSNYRSQLNKIYRS